jgi:uncharacterized protein DUF3185
MRNLNRIFGVVVLMVGIALLIVGVNAPHSLVRHINELLAGRLTYATTWYILGGSAVALLGILMMRFGIRGLNA